MGAAKLSKLLNISVRNVYDRRKRLEEKIDKPICAPEYRNSTTRYESAYPKRIPLEVENGVVIIGSDAHYWPGIVSTAHRGFIHLIKELKPAAVILNGDVFDGARISRHPPIGWADKPTIKQELDTVDERTEEIRKAAVGSRLFWLLGNHCQRFENRLAMQAAEFKDVDGFSLKDHFPFWTLGISLWINDCVAIKHRMKGGIHATHNNTLWAGMSTVTGHLHSLKVTPFSDYNGTRYGVDTGTLAEPYGEQFDYTEDNVSNCRSGFIVLTFHEGRLLWPEVCRVVDENHVEFRGQVIAV